MDIVAARLRAQLGWREPSPEECKAMGRELDELLGRESRKTYKFCNILVDVENASNYRRKYSAAKVAGNVR
jgi:hypothetical protein